VSNDPLGLPLDGAGDSISGLSDISAALSTCAGCGAPASFGGRARGDPAGWIEGTGGVFDGAQVGGAEALLAAEVDLYLRHGLAPLQDGFGIAAEKILGSGGEHFACSIKSKPIRRSLHPA